ncbi:calpain-8-like [Sander lucioperca]|uniref:calpain-8-like n=1 Tax=Sander lucioperca TaxID=283035 RepID=UPI00165375D4|nr:calpain-8-like [Sander lucioperca]
MPPPGVCLNIMEARQKQHGYGSFTNPDRFFNQDYQELKQCCVTQGVKYIDQTFPPNRNSIGKGILRPSDLARVVWLRPEKIAPCPAFVLDGVSRFDFAQGVLGNCWFLASIGALTFQDDILGQVVPLEQNFDEKYCGLFHFRFWRFGRWMDVVIDDMLPTINGKLIFVHSKDQNEFWPALMEKAYAKVCGSYTDMNAGTPAEAMMDFTGGVHMCINLSDPPANLWTLMCRAGLSKSLMGCGTPQGETPANNKLPNGLIQGHAYTVTGVKQMISRGKPVNLVRLWNPWGQGEWTGDWSDQSSLWKTVSAKDREMCQSVDDDGEFWMTLEDFCKFYSDLDICSLYPDFLDGNSSHWKTSMYEGRWVAGTTAGGCMNNKDSFWTNPQFRVKIDGEYSEIDGEKNVLVSLMQKSDKRNRHLVQNLHIGLTVFEVNISLLNLLHPHCAAQVNDINCRELKIIYFLLQYKAQKGKFPASFFRSHAPVAQTKTYMNARDVMEFLLLKPGEYVIVPSTFNPNEISSFILTILSKEETHGYENSDGDNHKQREVEEPMRTENVEDDDKKRTFFSQYSDKYEEVDAEQLHRLLNENVLKGDLKSGGFSIDACRSMVALMDTSITGKLNGEEFVRLWKVVITYKDIFFCTDVSQTGTLSLSELRNAIMVSGKRIRDDMLNLMAVRYGGSSGQITLESFISLMLRFDCMNQIFSQLSDGTNMTLRGSEWMYLSMYT